MKVFSVSLHVQRRCAGIHVNIQASNFQHYLMLQPRSMRPLQQRLALRGLSSVWCGSACSGAR